MEQKVTPFSHFLEDETYQDERFVKSGASKISKSAMDSQVANSNHQFSGISKPRLQVNKNLKSKPKTVDITTSPFSNLSKRNNTMRRKYEFTGNQRAGTWKLIVSKYTFTRAL